MKHNVIGIRSHTISDDGATVDLGFEAKDGSETSISMPSDYIGGIISALQTAHRAVLAKRKPTLNQMHFVRPETWAVGAHPLHDQVLLVFDAQTEMELGFALEPSAARAVAPELVKKADDIDARVAQRRNQ